MFASIEKVLEAQKWRYATKKFNPQKKIDDQTWKVIEDSLVLTPSSYGLQPWKFFIVQNMEKREALKAASWKQGQVVDCSHMVVFVIKEKLDEAHIDANLQAIIDTRNVTQDSLAGLKKMMLGDLVNGPRAQVIAEWAARQAYIALGNLMTTCALLGVDACPMEGIDPKKYDEILGLEASGWKTVVACPIGYRADDDKYAQIQKVRFKNSEVVTFIK